MTPKVREPGSVFQRETRIAISQLDRAPLLQGTLVTATLTTGTTAVPHTLGRPYRGFFVVDKTATCDIWRDASYTSQPATYLPLVSSAAVTVTLWVF